MDDENKLDIPFGAKDSELKGWAYTIPEGMEAEIKDGMVIVREKESEDDEERIRKNCIHFLNLQKEHHADTSEIDACIAYLEKQKEPHFTKRNAIFDKCVENCDPETMKKVSDSVDNMLQKEQKPEESITQNDIEQAMNALTDFKVFAAKEAKQYNISHQRDIDWHNFCASLLTYLEVNKLVEKPDYSGLTDFERAIHRGFLCAGVENVPVVIIKETAQDCLAEMKPAEWSEEDDDMRVKVTTVLNYLTAGGQDCVFAHETLVKLFYWTKSLPERFILHSKQEWSEEDERMLEECIMALSNWRDAVSNYGHEVSPCQKLIDWLKLFRPQHRDTYYDIIHDILATLKDIDFMKITPEHRVSLLNDIRVKFKNADECATILDEPHWAPSKEQMDALNALNLHGDFSYIGQQSQLVSLYNDLKKLM